MKVWPTLWAALRIFEEGKELLRKMLDSTTIEQSLGRVEKRSLRFEVLLSDIRKLLTKT